MELTQSIIEIYYFSILFGVDLIFCLECIFGGCKALLVLWPCRFSVANKQECYHKIVCLIQRAQRNFGKFRFCTFQVRFTSFLFR